MKNQGLFRSVYRAGLFRSNRIAPFSRSDLQGSLLSDSEGIRWLAFSFDVLTMITSELHGAKRMSELVQSMKSHSPLDQEVRQLVDVHDGLLDFGSLSPQRRTSFV